MSQDLIEAGRSAPAEMHGRSVEMAPGVNVGAVSIEMRRAMEEVRAQIMVAKDCPRSMVGAHTEFMDACKSPDFADAAFYSVPNRGSGPSIRFAEEVARCYGNFQYGHKELSRTDGKSEVEVFAWDMERNNRSTRQITIMHQVDTKNGPKVLKDQADIDNRIANIASKQIRGRILALVPKHLVASGIAECKRTLAGGNDKPVSERIKLMAGAFGKVGVTVDMLTVHLGHALDDTTVDELADMHGIYNAIKEGAKASEFFGAKDEPESDAATALASAGKAPAESKPAKEAKAKPAAQEKAPEPKEEPKDPPKAEEPPPAQEAAQEPSQAESEPKDPPATEAAQEQPQQAAPAARREAVF